MTIKGLFIMKYIYPAIFTPDDDAIIVDFPDVPHCYTDGVTMEEAFENAEDALSLMLYVMEREGREISPPSPPEKLTVPDGSLIALVKADTLPVRELNEKTPSHVKMPHASFAF